MPKIFHGYRGSINTINVFVDERPLRSVYKDRQFGWGQDDDSSKFNLSVSLLSSYSGEYDLSGARLEQRPSEKKRWSYMHAAKFQHDIVDQLSDTWKLNGAAITKWMRDNGIIERGVRSGT